MSPREWYALWRRLSERARWESVLASDASQRKRVEKKSAAREGCSGEYLRGLQREVAFWRRRAEWKARIAVAAWHRACDASDREVAALPVRRLGGETP